MTKSDRKTIRFRGKTEAVLETIRVRGRTYFAIEKLSHRGAFRVFDPHAGPDGDFRVLHRISKSDVTPQKIEILRRLGGENSNRNFPGIVDFAHHNNDLFVVVGWVAGTSLQAYLNSVRADKITQTKCHGSCPIGARIGSRRVAFSPPNEHYSWRYFASEHRHHIWHQAVGLDRFRLGLAHRTQRPTRSG